MSRIRMNPIFVAGILAPAASIALYITVYSTLTSASHNLKSDWLFRLSVSTIAMMLPSILVLFFAIRKSRSKPLNTFSKVGVGIAVLTLGLVARPLIDGVLRFKQERNMAMRGVAAPLFETADIDGKAYRLTDEKGKVVLINRWATWCGPCRVEMPELDHLYKERKGQGLVILGLSDEDGERQKRFLQKVPVSYPMLTMSSGVSGFYRDIARYPASFLIDREGRLQPIPDTGDSFEGIKNEVDRLLDQSSQQNRP